MQREFAYLVDILNSAKKAVEYLMEKNIEEFLNDTQCQDAVIRRLEIIGEASGRVDELTQTRYSTLPWKEMKSMRNLLIHEYDEVDMEEVWRTVKNDLPDLLIKLEGII